MNLLFRRAAFTIILIVAVLTAHAKTASEIYEQAAKSTVVVKNFNDEGNLVSLGSGVVLPDGSVVTNCHVVKDASQLKVHSNKNIFPARLQLSDLDRDVCSLSVEGLNAPAIVIGSSKTLKVGAKVFAIGAPQGLELTLSDGIVSNLREVEGGHYLQITAAISSGSSGGGLFDENGALVGLTTFFVTDGQNLNFAVPVEWVEELAERHIMAEQKAEADRKAEERKKLLAEKKAQAEEKARAKQQELAEKKLQVEKELAELKAQAEQERARAAQAAAIGKEVAEYTAKITAKIRRNIVMLPDIPYNVTAEFYVTLLPSGMVLEAELIKPSGSAAYDRAVKRAIKKAQPLPLPPDAALFDRFRELHLTVKPIDE